MVRNRKIALLILAPLVATIGGIGGLLATTSAQAEPSPAVGYAENPDGQTIGDLRLDGVEPDGSPRVSGTTVEGDILIAGELPDLIPAGTDSGLAGYIYTEDFLPSRSEATTPEEAVEMMKGLLNDSGDYVIPVYDFDGKTKIGEFTAAHVAEGSTQDE